MTAQPVPQPAVNECDPPPFAVVPGPEDRLAALHAQYADAKAEKDAADEHYKAITDAIKTDLLTAAAAADPGNNRVELRSAYGPVLRLTNSRPWRVDSKRLKAEQPYIYAAYAVQGDSWSLRMVPGGEG
ncbi:hypothetical protein RB608_11790 [Nocardioides sp. LHD-245]|uniref:hypothetical protein n=1 Tax=Nocardioides sp. LHD-245 TaxID=3051387 RepID=UPI0027E02B2C|nr:hypothetical protein [Nocardioides sp. LHD-245]